MRLQDRKQLPPNGLLTPEFRAELKVLALINFAPLGPAVVQAHRNPARYHMIAEAAISGLDRVEDDTFSKLRKDSPALLWQ